MTFLARLRKLSTQRKFSLITAALLVQATIVAILLPQIGSAAGTVSLATIILCGLLFGVKGGILSVLVAILLNSFLGMLVIDEPFLAFLRGGILIGIAALMAVGALVGYLSSLQYKLDTIRSTLERDVAERTAKLQTINEELRAEVAERQEIEAALRRAKTTLEGTTQARDHFLASISHELRTPLTMIMGQTDALQEGLYGELNEEQQDAVNQVLQSSNHLLKLIDNILDYNRFTTQNVSINKERVTIGPIGIAALQMIEHMANEKSVELIYEDHAGDVFVAVDEVQVTQMLVNLLDNAIKFTSAGGQVGLSISINSTLHPINAESVTEANSETVLEENLGAKAQIPDDEIILSVWDTGIGMSQKDVASIFEPFVQIHTGDGVRRTGAGLGLSLVRQMIALHDGHIKVESTVGQGSRFTITLPIETS